MRAAAIACAAAWAAATAGCAEPPTGAMRQAVSSDPCGQEWRCGGNSPVINAQGFHDMSLFGAWNEAGLAPQQSSW